MSIVRRPLRSAMASAVNSPERLNPARRRTLISPSLQLTPSHFCCSLHGSVPFTHVASRGPVFTKSSFNSKSISESLGWDKTILEKDRNVIMINTYEGYEVKDKNEDEDQDQDQDFLVVAVKAKVEAEVEDEDDDEDEDEVDMVPTTT